MGTRRRPRRPTGADLDADLGVDVDRELEDDPSLDPPPLADVFLSYSRKDEAVAERLAETLTDEGFLVWFDRDIRAGTDWERSLRGVLAAAKAVLVLWSERSVQSRWVRLEARVALRTHRLVPVRIDECELPPAFRSVETALLVGWDGGAHPELEVLLSGLARLAPPSRIDTVRPGYDANFLGVEVPLPGVVGVADELRYQHFSVVMNPARRLAWYSAANIARRGIDVPRGDRWMADPQVPAAFQPGNEHFRGSGLDRGHLTRPRAVSWGEQRLAQISNRQTFFWTNTAPQHPDMNRRWWLAVEQWEDGLLEAFGAVVSFSGPALAPDDPVHRDLVQVIGRLRVRANFRLPRAFWKLVAVRDGDVLRTAAFWLDQDALVALGARSNDTAQWRCTVVELEERTSVDFGAGLRHAPELRR